MNQAQEVLYSIKHPKTITLKSRQRGISTFKVAENLDKCIFIPNSQTGIQSYGQSEARKLYRKALFMWENLDPDIVGLLGIKVTSSNQEGITFNNGSILKIGNFRGDTLSSLHVSELAKIAKKYPEKAEELNTGAFEAVSTNSAISIESTAEGNTGLFHDIYRTAERRLREVGGNHSKLSPLDFAPVFLSWIEDDDCKMDTHYPPTRQDIEYFNKVEAELNLQLTQGQKNWACAKRERLGNKFDQEYPYSANSAFNIKIEGTYYSNEYEKITLQSDNYDSNLLVHSVMDLGMNDLFSIIFFQTFRNKVKIIGEYQNRGFGLEHYRDIFAALVKSKGWQFHTDYVPHDIVVRELTSGQTRYDKMLELGFKPVIVPKHRVIDGIEYTRTFLSSELESIDPECNIVLNAIQNYRQKFDEKYRVYLDAPLHDEHSHPADALRYLAMGLLHSYPDKELVADLVITKRQYRQTGMDI